MYRRVYQQIQSQRTWKAARKKCWISAPGEVDVDATVVYGVNDDVITEEDMTVISNASCTTNCLAPVAKVLSENIGIVKGAMTTIHALTNDQTVTDVRQRLTPRPQRCGKHDSDQNRRGKSRRFGIA